MALCYLRLSACLFPWQRPKTNVTSGISYQAKIDNQTTHKTPQPVITHGNGSVQ